MGLRRPNDEDAVRAELRRGQRESGLPVLFGGVVEDGESDLSLSGFVGTRGTMLRNLVINAECGLGGRTIAERRPGAVTDYAHSTEITHEYDREVASEGIESLLAVPAVVGGRTRAVLYGGLRSVEQIGDRVIGLLSLSASRLAREMSIRDEVDRRVALIVESSGPPAGAAVPAAVADGIVESYVALREIARLTTDPALAQRLQEVEERLRTLGGPGGADAPTLSPREREVLEYVSLGCGNAEIADRLGLTVDTVKSYLRNLMGKLEVHSRHEAVSVARRAGILP